MSIKIFVIGSPVVDLLRTKSLADERKSNVCVYANNGLITWEKTLLDANVAVLSGQLADVKSRLDHNVSASTRTFLEICLLITKHVPR